MLGCKGFNRSDKYRSKTNRVLLTFGYLLEGKGGEKKFDFFNSLAFIYLLFFFLYCSTSFCK